MSKAKKGKDKKKGDDEVKDKSKDMNFILSVQLETLQQKLIYEQERAERARANQDRLKIRFGELDGSFKKEKEKRDRIAEDMNRQYETMQNDLLNEIRELEEQVAKSEQILRDKTQDHGELKRKREGDLEKKDEEILELKKKIEEMSAEFANMLKDTLDKMQERIELAKNDFDDIDIPALKKD